MKEGIFKCFGVSKSDVKSLLSSLIENSNGVEYEIEGENLVAKTEKEYLYNLIANDQNILSIKRALRYLGINLGFAIKKVEPKDEKVLKDIEFLKDKFKDNLIVE